MVGAFADWKSVVPVHNGLTNYPWAARAPTCQCTHYNGILAFN